MKKVLVFSTAYAPQVGGAEVAIAEIAKRLKSTTTFCLVTFRFNSTDARRETVDGVEVHRLGYGTAPDRFFLFPLLAFFHGLRLIRRENIDLLWGVMVSYASIGAYFLKLFHPRIPFLLTLQEGDSEEHLRRGKLGLVGWWWKRLVRRADHIQAISRYLADYASQMGARCPMDVVPNGVDIAGFSSVPSNAMLDAFRRHHGISQDSIIVITVSRLVEKNAIDVCIAALRLLPENYRLFIAGSGPLEGRLRRLAEGTGIAPRVIFAGTMNHEEIQIALHAARLFVRPSRSEGLGNAFLESMAAGTPVIATNVGGIRDFLEDAQTGLSVRCDDAQDLAEKIRKLAEDEALHSRLSRAGYALVYARYDWNSIARRMDEVFSAVQNKNQL